MRSHRKGAPEEPKELKEELKVLPVLSPMAFTMHMHPKSGAHGNCLYVKVTLQRVLINKEYLRKLLNSLHFLNSSWSVMVGQYQTIVSYG